MPTRKQVLLFLPRLVFWLCYSIGWLILALLTVVWPSSAVRHRLALKLKNWRQMRPGFTLVSFVLLAAIILGSFQAATLVASGQKLAGQVLGTADNGLTHLGEAQNLLAQQDANGASERLALALQSFEKSRTDLNSNNLLLQSLLNLVPQKQDADRLLQATILLTQAGQEWTQFYQLSQTVKITPQGLTGNAQSGQILQQMNDHLQAGRDKTNQGLALISQVDATIIPHDKREAFLQIKGNLTAIQTAVNSVGEVFDILYQIAAGKKKVFLVFENSNELRATGGFMGTFGAMDLHDGAIEQLHISSIYDLDGQLKEKIAPPRPLATIIPQWYLRDTNWFTDFPQTAQVITRFYEMEGGETPDLIVALTPQLIVDWLKITGPITLSRYNVTFNSDNFLELAQAESSVNYDKTLNQPKQVLADFFPALLQQLGTLSGAQLLPVITSLQKNLLTKQILLYSRNAELQAKLEKFNWTGAIRSTDRDYLLVSNSNLGGTKTDNYIKQSVKLDSAIDNDSHITNTLTITRTNPLADQPQFVNKSFVRVYVPQGSKLLQAQGFTPEEQPHLAGDLKADPNVAAWEAASVTDTVSGTLIGRESGKTIFGNWLELKGGESKTVTLTYQLPFTLNDIDHYSLLLQKQPGTAEQAFNYNLTFGGYNIAWSNFQAQTLASHSLEYTQTMTRDMFLGLIFQTP